MRRAVLLVAAAFALGGRADAGGMRARLAPPARGLQVRLSHFDVRADTEREVCQRVTLPNRKPVDVQGLTIAMPSGSTWSSHHFAIFVPGDGGASASPEPVDSVGCLRQGGELLSPILAFVQRSRQRIQFPAGVGFTLLAHQVLLLNSHYVNGGGSPVGPDVAINFRAARAGAIRHHVRSFQLGTVRIDVPAGAEASVDSSWTVPFAMNVVWLSSHSHKHTTAVTVDLVAAGTTVTDHDVVTHDYAQPDFRYYPEPRRLEAGDQIRWTCRYRNTTPHRVTFGVTSEDEMCFAVGFFYPDDDAGPTPVVPRCASGSAGLVCPVN